MAGQNCWDFNKCGREPEGEKTGELGICPAAVFDGSDGFCGGKNGGRACMYIAGTFCLETISKTHAETWWKDCGNCDFFKILMQEHGPEASASSFKKYVNKLSSFRNS